MQNESHKFFLASDWQASSLSYRGRRPLTFGRVGLPANSACLYPPTLHKLGAVGHRESASNRRPWPTRPSPQPPTRQIFDKIPEPSTAFSQSHGREFCRIELQLNRTSSPIPVLHFSTTTGTCPELSQNGWRSALQKKKKKNEKKKKTPGSLRDEGGARTSPYVGTSKLR